MFLQELFALLGDDTGNFHSHKCACGHEWAHADTSRRLPSPEFEDAHTCARCGAEQFTKNQKILSQEQADELNNKS